MHAVGREDPEPNQPRPCGGPHVFRMGYGHSRRAAGFTVPPYEIHVDLHMAGAGWVRGPPGRQRARPASILNMPPRAPPAGVCAAGGARRNRTSLEGPGGGPICFIWESGQVLNEWRGQSSGCPGGSPCGAGVREGGVQTTGRVDLITWRPNKRLCAMQSPIVRHFRRSVTPDRSVSR